VVQANATCNKAVFPQQTVQKLWYASQLALDIASFHPILTVTPNLSQCSMGTSSQKYRSAQKYRGMSQKYWGVGGTALDVKKSIIIHTAVNMLTRQKMEQII